MADIKSINGYNLKDAQARQDLQTHANNGEIHVSELEKNTWSGKYAKPTGGIPKTDLDSNVRSSLDKADSALQEHQSLESYRTASAQDIIDASKVGVSDYAPIEKTAAMTQAVGKDTDGKLYTEPGGGGGADENAVHYTAETKTEAQKAQARTNIGLTSETWTFYDENGTSATKTVVIL